MLVSVYRLAGELINFQPPRVVLCSFSKFLSCRRTPAILRQIQSSNIFLLFKIIAQPASKLSCSWTTWVSTRWESYRLTRFLNPRGGCRRLVRTRAFVNRCEHEWKQQIWCSSTGLLLGLPSISCLWLRSKRAIRLKPNDSLLQPSVSFLGPNQTSVISTKRRQHWPP